MGTETKSLEIAMDNGLGGFRLPAMFWQPAAPIGVVLSLQPGQLDRLLPSDRSLLEELAARGFAVLAMGLLSAEEESAPETARTRRFDIPELSARAVKAIDWIGAHGATMPFGVVARGTAAAAALVASSQRRLGAMVSIAGRPDLAAEVLPRIEVPTLFLVGADHVPSLHFSQIGSDRMYCARELRVIAGSGPLEWPAEAKVAAKMALEWFERHLPARAAVASLVVRDASPTHGRPEATGRWRCIVPGSEAREISLRRGDFVGAQLPTNADRLQADRLGHPPPAGEQAQSDE